MKKKISALLLSVILVTSLMCIPALASGTAQIHAGSPEASTAESTLVELPVYIGSNPGLAVGRVDVKWNAEVLELTGIDYTEGLGRNNGSPMEGEVVDGEPTEGIINDGEYPVSFGSYVATENWTENGLLFTLKFKVKANAEATEYVIGLSGDSSNFLNVDIEEKAVAFADGKITLKDPQVEQTITGAGEITGTYGDAAVELDYEAMGDISYALDENEKIIKIENGKLYFLKAGTTSFKVKAEATTGYLAAEKTVSVTVAHADQNIILGAESMSGKVGAAADLPTATAQTDISYTVTSGTDVIEIDGGKVYFRKAGNAVITVAAEATEQYNGASKEISVTVTDLFKQEITCEEEIELAYGQIFTMTAEAKGKITYAVTAGEEVISIDEETGVVTIHKVGNAEITVYAAATADYAAGSATVSVTVAAADYTYAMTADKQYVKVGSGLNKITVAPEAGTGVGGAAVNGTLTWYTDAERTTEATDAVFGSTGEVKLYWSFTANDENYTAVAKTGEVTFTAAAIGDVNCDGEVLASDAMILARYAAHWEGYEARILCADTADVTGDGVVDGLDATLLARFVAGWSGIEF